MNPISTFPVPQPDSQLKDKHSRTMKTQFPVIKILVHAAAALIATAVASSSLAATVAFGDFNNDGLLDMAAITSPTTITVSLANLDGSHTVSAILSAPKNQQVTDVGVNDADGDGNLDVYANSPANGGWVYTHVWSGHGDGTFGSRTTNKWAWPPKGNPRRGI